MSADTDLHAELSSARAPQREAKTAAKSARPRLELDREDLVFLGRIAGTVLAVFIVATLAAALLGWIVRVFLATSGLT